MRLLTLRSWVQVPQAVSSVFLQKQMATKRFVLYVKHEEDAALLYPWMKAQTHVQLVDKLPDLPGWLKGLALPVIVDKQKLEAAWGPEQIEAVMQSRKPATKFSNAAVLDEI